MWRVGITTGCGEVFQFTALTVSSRPRQHINCLFNGITSRTEHQHVFKLQPLIPRFPNRPGLHQRRTRLSTFLPFLRSMAASHLRSCSTWLRLDGTKHFNWQVAASSFLPDGFRRVGWGGAADVAALHVVFLAVACWCNRAITLFVIWSGSWACHGAASTLTDYRRSERGCRSVIS